jgi:hypothetical protein
VTGVRLLTLRTLPTLLVVVALAGGCGSKINEPNYYKVQHGMTEEDVEDLLGPPHEEQVSTTTAPPVTEPTDPPVMIVTGRTAERKIKIWTHGDLTIRVAFEKGIVVARSADGIPFEGEAHQSHPTTVPVPT